jgi:hypothetical protein
MVDLERDPPLEGVVEVDQAEIPFREGDAFFEPGNAAVPRRRIRRRRSRPQPDERGPAGQFP